jgi:hypothetical protein
MMPRIFLMILTAGALTGLCGCDSFRFTPGVTLFDPHDPKNWGTAEDQYWQEHGYSDPQTISFTSDKK